jgi:hypothetical protein
MDPHEEMPAVVYCVLSNTSDVQTLDLSAAESPSGLKPEMNAKEVEVKASSGERYVFEHVGGTLWKAGFRPEYGTKYTLHVMLHSGEELTAETVFPDSVAVNDTYHAHDEKFFNRYGDRSFNKSGLYPSGIITAYNQTRDFGFKIMDPADLEPQYINGDHFHEDSRIIDSTKEDIAQEKKSYVEMHPYQKSCFLWITARSPQKPEEFPLDALYVPGHEYRSVYLATDMDAVDHFNALPLTFGDLACYSTDNVKRIEQAIEERDRELIPAFYEIWSSYWVGGEHGTISWYGSDLGINSSFSELSKKYSALPLHLNFLRLVYPEGGYRNEYSLSDPDQTYRENGDAVWRKNRDDNDIDFYTFPSPFTFQLFADFNLDDPYTWQYTAHKLSTGWVVFEFHNASEEYDAFLRSLYKSGYSDVFGDLTQSLYSREGVYSNVSGGTGIFGAECVTVSLR